MVNDSHKGASAINTVDNACCITLPASRETLMRLRVGERCLLTGPMYMLRDAGHKLLLDEIDKNKDDTLPYGLDGNMIFYAGPTPPAAGRPFGAVGPTTSSRMDFAAPRLHELGVVATIGKGLRSKAVRDACIATKSVYFITTGGVAALLAKCVTSGEVVAYEKLGTEALRRIEVKDFPVMVAIDTKGNDIYE
ncbi:MAG: fumarate hydratase C-terminal domain-containing protein [Eggerthellaceae bacterium]|nr:fumarate hydratase C-terminal domain-containing protein [Eggerthellaceae bacterium]